MSSPTPFLDRYTNTSSGGGSSTPTLDKYTTGNMPEDTPDPSNADGAKWWQSGFSALGTIGSAYFTGLKPAAEEKKDYSQLYGMILALIVVGGAIFLMARAGRKSKS